MKLKRDMRSPRSAIGTAANIRATDDTGADSRMKRTLRSPCRVRPGTDASAVEVMQPGSSPWTQGARALWRVMRAATAAGGLLSSPLRTHCGGVLPGLNRHGDVHPRKGTCGT